MYDLTVITPFSAVDIPMGRKAESIIAFADFDMFERAGILSKLQVQLCKQAWIKDKIERDAGVGRTLMPAIDGSSRKKRGPKPGAKKKSTGKK